MDAQSWCIGGDLISMFETHCVLGHMCMLLAEQTVLSRYRLFSISHCKVPYSTSPRFRGSVWSVLTQMPASAWISFSIFKTLFLATWEWHWDKNLLWFYVLEKENNEWKYYFEEILVQQSVGPRTITQPAFISVLTLFSIYFTALLHITCGPEIRASTVFPKLHFFQS